MMSSCASIKLPTPGTSSSSKQPAQTLAEELEGAPMSMDSDDKVNLKKETYERLHAKVKEGDEDIA